MTRSRERTALGWLFLTLVVCVLQPTLAHDPKTHRVDPSATVEPETGPELAELWGCPMCETVREPRAGRCPICRMELVQLEPSRATGDVLATNPQGNGEASGSGIARSKPGGRVRALMPGVPDWLFYAAAISILVISFVLAERCDRVRQARAGERRWNLFRIPGLKGLVRRRWFQLSLQVPVLLLFGVILAAGLFGNQAPERNIAPILTWTLWWTWLALVILFLGKLWCTVCPWMTIADWLTRRGLRQGARHRNGLDKRWPKKLRNIWLATFLFLLLTWLELGYGVTEKPWLTALLGLAMVLACLGTVLVFERKAFCRYACLVGRVSGLYSMFAASELRSADKQICRKCSTKDCYHGNESGAACPTHQFLGSMESNTYCTLCLECVRTCPVDNVSWNLRPFGSDLLESSRTRVDEAYLSVILLSMSAFHGLTMTPAWDGLVQGIQTATGANRLMAFTLGMAAIVLLPIVIYYGICGLIKRFAGDREHSVRFLFIRFSYSLLPIALFYHLAHNLQHIFFEGKKLVRAASDPFGRGWDLFGTADMLVDAVLPIEVGWGIQVALIIVGHVFGIVIAHRAARSLYDSARTATLSQIPLLAAMLLFSFQSLWLIAQPMVMRTAM